MKVTIIGKKGVSFTSKEGNPITGMTIFFAFETDGVAGMATDKVFVPTAKMPTKDVVVGKDVDLYFNRYGKVDSIIVS